MPPITIRATQPEDFPAIAELGKDNLETKWDEPFLKWKYLQNPVNPFYGVVAEADGKVLGCYGNIPVLIKAGAEVVTGAQAVDLAVAPEARRHGLFVKMAQQTYQQMDKDGVWLDYAFPNPASQAGFVTRLNWTPVGLAPRYIKIIDPKAITVSKGLSGLAAQALARGLAKLPVHASWHSKRPPAEAPGIEVHPADSFDPRADRLWEQAAADFPLTVRRDAAYLNWRYVDNPQKQYQILLAERGSGNANPPDLAGYCVLSFKDRTSQSAAALAELLLAPGETSAGLALLAQATAQAQEAGCAQIWCWMLPQHTFYTCLLRLSGFHHLSSRNRTIARLFPGFLSSTTPFIIRLNPGFQSSIDPTRLGNWYVTMGDHDYY
jgi:GNAT superfamily N-acetyltransferase